MTNMGCKDIFFFLGTEAELIKVFPVIMECMQRGGICHVIASGQNDLTKSRIMREVSLNERVIGVVCSDISWGGQENKV